MSLDIERVRPYEGNEKYIFVSYSHRDMAKVMPIVKRLIEEGYRVWYDEGIDPGSEWPESIARHLDGSSVCMYFISENSLKSSNCKREVNFALSRNIGFLSVALEKAEIPLGLELQIASYMSLVKYKYPSDEVFMDRLLSLEILKPCRREITPAPEVIEEPAPAAISAPEPSVIKEPVKTKEEPEKPKEAVKEEVREEKPVQKPVKVKKPKESKPPKEKKQGKSPVKIIGIIAAAVVIGLIAIIFGMGGSGKKATITIGTKEYTAGSYMNITGQTITSADMKKLTQIEDLSTLLFSDCAFEDNALELISQKPKLRILNLNSCSGVSDLSFINNLGELRELVISDCSINDDMLAQITLPESLRKLSFSSNQLKVLPDLSSCTSITELNLNHNEISSIDGLADYSQIEKLYVGYNKISDISVLETFIYLKEINLASNGIASLDALHNCTVLTTVNISGNSEIKDISVIAANAKTLNYLSANGLPKADFSVLEKCTALTQLNVNSCELKDLSFAKNMKVLNVLNAADNQISDISGIRSDQSLKVINLAGNQIESLQNFPQNLYEETLYVLLHDNQLKGLDELPSGKEYYVLTLFSNPWENVQKIKDLDGFYVVLDYLPVFDKEALNVFTKVLVTSVDLSEKLALEKALSTRLHYVTEEEALKEITEYFSSVSIVLP